jgi:hypothetical protein
MAEHVEVIARARLGEETGRQFARAISMVQLVGSDAAREAVRAVHNATVLVGRTLDPPSNIDRDAALAAVQAMFGAVDAFLDAVRPETAGAATAVEPARRRRLFKKR